MAASARDKDRLLFLIVVGCVGVNVGGTSVVEGGGNGVEAEVFKLKRRTDGPN